ncbi:MAG: haloacid dehalogenase [Mucilaginibacter sp.]|nr:haloacid dehalogenase [Mucilaginibacter sp.]
MIKYSDIGSRKEAFIFELDDVLYPEKDYLYQVYYLFASFLEYTELVDLQEATSFMINTYSLEGKGVVFDRLKQKFKLDEKYTYNFNHLNLKAKLPAKLLLYQDMLNLMQEIVIDRKQLFILTNGDPEQQLNKIKQTEWHGLEPYLTCYFANETAPKPETDSIDLLIKNHKLQRRNILMIGNSDIDRECADASGVDLIKPIEFSEV